MLLSLSVTDIARIDSASDRAFIKNTIRLIDIPHLKVPDSDMRRINTLVERVIKRPSSPPEPEPDPTPKLEPAPDSTRVLELEDPPRGVTRRMLYDYLDALDALQYTTEHTDDLAVVRNALAHDARKSFYRQKLNVRSVTCLLPTKWADGWKRWVVCRVGLTDHFVQRWRQRSGRRLNTITPALTATVPASAEFLLDIGLSWQLIGSVLVEPDSYHRYGIDGRKANLALRNEKGVILLSHSLHGGRFKGFTATTYLQVERDVRRVYFKRDEPSLPSLGLNQAYPERASSRMPAWAVHFLHDTPTEPR